jgi:hypothetical protein
LRLRGWRALAAIELRGLIHDGDEAPIWRDALGAFVAGLARTPITLTPGAFWSRRGSAEREEGFVVDLGATVVTDEQPHDGYRHAPS